jgi:hypothetical protein
MRSLTLLRTLVYCLIALPATAQSTFAGVRLDKLPTVFVTDRSGTETAGKLVRLTDSVVELRTEYGDKRFTADEVSLIERDGDSLKNGTLTGFYTGLFVDLMVWKSCQRDCGSGTATFALITTGLYTAIGTAIDAAIPGRTRIWPAKGKSATSHLAFAIAPARRTAFVGWRLR